MGWRSRSAWRALLSRPGAPPAPASWTLCDLAVNMAIPVSYNLRNLVVRKTTTVITALGIALTVAVLLAVLALVNGLKTAFQSSGDPLQILVMRKGATAELSSAVTREVFQDLKSMAGIARDGDEPMASLEMVTVINLPSVDSPTGNECHPARDPARRYQDARRSQTPGWPLVSSRTA